MRTLILFLTVGFAVVAYGKEWPCTKLTLPALRDGCEGERCESADKIIRKEVTLHEKPDRRSKVVGRLKKGQRVESIEHKTLATQFGKYTVHPDPSAPEAMWAIQELKPYGVQLGDVVIAVQYRGEGVYVYCVGDTVFEGTGESYGLQESQVPGEKVESEAWSHIKSKAGSGWAFGGDWYRSLGD